MIWHEELRNMLQYCMDFVIFCYILLFFDSLLKKDITTCFVMAVVIV